MPGHDGHVLDQLLDNTTAQVSRVLQRLTRQALQRLLSDGTPTVPFQAPRFFTEAELAELADAQAAGLGTSALLGRALVRDYLAREQAAEQVQESVAGDEVFSDLHEALKGVPVDPLPPERAVEYFRGLVPTLGVDPQRFGEQLRRHALTLAAATDEAVVGRVQQILGDYLEHGTHRPAAGKIGQRTVRYVAHPNAEPTERLVLVDPAKLDADWRKDTSYYLPSGEKGPSEIKGRREGFEKFLATNQAIEASRVVLTPEGVPSFTDGRHRMAVLRDKGATHVAVMVPAEQEAAVRAKYGATEPPPRDGLTAPKAVQDVLDRAGVSPANPQYAEMVTRTNMMDAYNQASDEARTDPDVIEFFPVWMYSNPHDGRSRPKHAERDGKYYPARVKFLDVRGQGIEDAANCRCTPIPVSRRRWQRLRDEGARIADGYEDVAA